MDRGPNFSYSAARISIVAWAMTALRRAKALPSQVSRHGRFAGWAFRWMGVSLDERDGSA
jgi:hypothetical protein